MQTVKKLSELFDIWYGVNLELNKMELCETDSDSSINFVSRTEKNNGVSAVVKKINGIKPNPANTISVAGGGSVLASFVQTEEYYSGRDLYILSPKKPMTNVEMLFYCSCIRKNRYKYNYGRQANKTLKDILIPSTVPDWVKKLPKDIGQVSSQPLIESKKQIKTENWSWFKYSQLFDIERGKGPRLKEVKTIGANPFITSTDQNNGWNGWTDHLPMHDGNVLSVTRNGSVGEAFYQPVKFCSTEDVHIFIPKFELNSYIALFLTTLIRKEKYRYNYGRKWGLQRMNDTYIMLPSKNNKPDFDFMESFIKALPYSSSI